MEARPRRISADLGVWVLVAAPLLLNGGGDGATSGWARSWTEGWAGSGWATAAGAGLLGVAVAAGRRYPLVPLCTALGLGALFSSQLITPQYSVALAVFAYLTGRRAHRDRPVLDVLGGVTVFGLLGTVVLGEPLWTWFVQVAALLLAVVVPWLLGRYVRRYAELVRAGWRLADRLEREQRAVADRERLRERSRIAGDMHDSLGHDLSLIALRAAALEVDRELGEPQRAAARELRLAAAGATERLREVVGVLRGDGEAAPTAPRDETVRALVERARDSGLAVRLEEEHAATDGGPLPEMTDRAVHRVVQEALTNAAKHAPGAEVVVRVVRAGGSVAVTVGNGRAPRAATGAGAGAGAGAVPDPAAAISGGTGLVGLDERVRLAGGVLTHGPVDGGGFTVGARLPVSPASGPAEPPGPAGPAEPTGPPEPGGPDSARELELARRRVRRGLRQAIVVPVTIGTVLALLMLGFEQYTLIRSTVHRADFDAIRVGDPRSEVLRRLPEHRLPGRPAGVDPEPPGVDRCVYHRADTLSDTPAYRFCFTADRLSSKAVVTDVPNEELRYRGTAPEQAAGAAGQPFAGAPEGSRTSPRSAGAASSGCAGRTRIV
ncbi:histidine kinase [Streptomyces sp. NPDC006798]|uniref:sensor histidine kinase n=1 Tax=Streptomyces sp. NPDC006798 TaxID=3155462 RepID=UPI0033E10586